MTDIVFINLKKLECGVCNIVFAIPLKKYDKCKNDGSSFYCPNGHNLVFTENKADKLQKELDDLKQHKDFYQQQYKNNSEKIERLNHKVRGLKSANTRLKKK